MKAGRNLLLLGLILLALAACSPAASPIPTTAPLALNATSQPTPDDWDNRAIFRSGLIQAEQETLSQLPGASVYHLDVQIADDCASLQGRERVRYTNRSTQPLSAIYFQLFPNLAGGTSIVSGVLENDQPVSSATESDASTLRVMLALPLQPGQSTVIQLDFKVTVPLGAGGNYGLFGYIDDILVLDGFYPAIPVNEIKGWHAGKVPPNADTTFQDASFYVVNVSAPASLVLVASGTQVERTLSGSRQQVTFAAGPARDFYLAGSSSFTLTSQQVGETTVNSYAFAKSAEGSRLALTTVTNALKIYSARLGAYPYTEFDLVSTPMQGAYGIEYPGLAGINYTLYDLKATIAGAPAASILESTVAHEAGHQWFYNLVGNDQANEPWLDEAVTQYITGLYYLDQYGQSGYASYRSSWVSRWERVNSQPIPIGRPAGSYQAREYGAIVYGRGPLFVEALAQSMGQDKFDTFLRAYVQTHRWGIATAAAFRQQAETACACDLTALFDKWVNN